MFPLSSESSRLVRKDYICTGRICPKLITKHDYLSRLKVKEVVTNKESNFSTGEIPEVIFYLFIIAFALLEMFISLKYGWIVVTDSPVYIEASKWFLGQLSLNESTDIEVSNEILFHPWYRIGFIRPTVVFLAAVLSLFTDIVTAYIIVNACFWLGSIFMLYRYSFFLLKNRKLAVYSCLLFSSSLTILVIGLAVLTDMGGFFFLILTFYLIINPPKKTWQNYLVGIIFGIALLTRQSLALPFIFLVMFELTTEKNWKRIVTIICSAVLVSGSYILFMYLNFGFDVFSMLIYNTTVQGISSNSYNYGNRWGLIPFIASITNAFFPVIILGIIGGYAKYRLKELRPYDLMLILIIPSLIITPFMSQRFAFLLFPAVLPLAAFGLQILSKKIASHYLNKPTWSNILEIVILFLCILLPNLWIIFIGEPYMEISKAAYRYKYIPII